MPIDTSKVKQFGLITRIPESQLQDIERTKKEQQAEADRQNAPEIQSLAAHLRKAWQAALTAKNSNGIEELLLDCLRRKTGKYSPKELTDIGAAGESPIYMKLTNIKCRACESWVRDIMVPPGDKPWSIEPTPIPDLPEAEEVKIIERVSAEATQFVLMMGPQAINDDLVQRRLDELEDKVKEDIQRKADKDAGIIEDHLQDDLVEGNFYRALGEFIKDLSIFPTAFIMGPIIRNKPRTVWTQDQKGEWTMAIDMMPRREYERVSPFDLYPGPGAKDLQDGYLCRRIKLRRKALQSCLGVPGFNDSAIRGALRDYGTGGLREWLAVDQERAEAESRDTEFDDPDPPIDCVEYWGSAQGKTLIEWGMSSKKITDPDLDYPIQAWLIGEYVVMARVNYHPLGHRPVYGASFDSSNDSIWGQSPPMLMDDIQDLCNATARALDLNLGIAAGPQVEIFMDRLQPGENPELLKKWKLWKTKSDIGGSGHPAVNFYQPNALAGILIEVFDYFFKQASEQTGIPAYIYGSMGAKGGAGDTASGLSMLMNAATKTLKNVVANIDEQVIKPIIRDLWLQVMLYDDDVPKIGDVNIIARASEHLIMAEQMQLRRSEALERTNNPVDLSIIGPKGRATQLRDYFNSLKMNTSKIVPSENTMEAKERAMQQGPPAAAPPPGQPPGGAPMSPDGGMMGKEPGRMMQ